MLRSTWSRSSRRAGVSTAAKTPRASFIVGESKPAACPHRPDLRKCALMSSIAVMGAGAVGCYYGGMLARAGHKVVLIGRPQHVDAVQRAGLRLQAAAFDEQVRLKASADPSAAQGADVVLFSVKSPDTEAAGKALEPYVERNAAILTLQNGVDNAERLAATLSREVIPAVVYVA